jgi:hypothetical protein
MFWFKSIQLLVEAHKLDYNSDRDSYDKCLKILKKSLELVDNEKKNRQNKLYKLEYIEAMLSYEMAEIICDGVLNDRLNEDDISKAHAVIAQKSSLRKNSYLSRNNSMYPKLFKKLSGVCSVRIFLTKTFKLIEKKTINFLT